MFSLGFTTNMNLDLKVFTTKDAQSPGTFNHPLGPGVVKISTGPTYPPGYVRQHSASQIHLREDRRTSRGEGRRIGGLTNTVNVLFRLK